MRGVKEGTRQLRRGGSVPLTKSQGATNAQGTNHVSRTQPHTKTPPNSQTEVQTPGVSAKEEGGKCSVTQRERKGYNEQENLGWPTPDLNLTRRLEGKLVRHPRQVSDVHPNARGVRATRAPKLSLQDAGQGSRCTKRVRAEGLSTTTQESPKKRKVPAQVKLGHFPGTHRQWPVIHECGQVTLPTGGVTKRDQCRNGGQSLGRPRRPGQAQTLSWWRILLSIELGGWLCDLGKEKTNTYESV